MLITDAVLYGLVINTNILKAYATHISTMPVSLWEALSNFLTVHVALGSYNLFVSVCWLVLCQLT